MAGRQWSIHSYIHWFQLIHVCSTIIVRLCIVTKWTWNSITSIIIKKEKIVVHNGTLTGNEHALLSLVISIGTIINRWQRILFTNGNWHYLTIAYIVGPIGLVWFDLWSLTLMLVCLYIDIYISATHTTILKYWLQFWQFILPLTMIRITENDRLPCSSQKRLLRIS